MEHLDVIHAVAHHSCTPKIYHAWTNPMKLFSVKFDVRCVSLREFGPVHGTKLRRSAAPRGWLKMPPWRCMFHATSIFWVVLVQVWVSLAWMVFQLWQRWDVPTTLNKTTSGYHNLCSNRKHLAHLWIFTPSACWWFGPWPIDLALARKEVVQACHAVTKAGEDGFDRVVFSLHYRVPFRVLQTGWVSFELYVEFPACTPQNKHDRAWVEVMSPCWIGTETPGRITYFLALSPNVPCRSPLVRNTGKLVTLHKQ